MSELSERDFPTNLTAWMQDGEVLTERRKKLIDALRSGKYKYGKGVMRRKPKDSQMDGMCEFCIMGVACEVFRLEYPRESRWIEYTGDVMSFEVGNNQYADDKPYTPVAAVLTYFSMSFDDVDNLVGANDDDDANSFDLAIELAAEKWGISL